jgi:hypothetical protein
MDRIEFIEMLQDRVAEQREILSDLHEEKTEKYKYTTEYLSEVIKPKKTEPMQMTFVDGTQPTTFTGHQIKKTNSTEQIIDIAHLLRKLEKECDDIREEIKSFDDVREILPYFNKGN